MSEIAEVLDISHSSAGTTLHYDVGYWKKCAKWVLRQLTDPHKRQCMEVGYWKKCAKWVPRQLTDPHKQQCMEVATEFLQCYEQNSFLLDGMVTGDETWVHHLNAENKRHSGFP